MSEQEGTIIRQALDKVLQGTKKADEEKTASYPRHPFLPSPLVIRTPTFSWIHCLHTKDYIPHTTL